MGFIEPDYVVLPPRAFDGSSTLQRRVLRVARELKCDYLIPGCSFVARGAHDSEVMKKFAEHAKHAHQMAAIGMEVERRARASIRECPGSNSDQPREPNSGSSARRLTGYPK
jgi:predicted small metal-binding protein